MKRLQNGVLILFVSFLLVECSQPAQQEATIKKDSLEIRDTGNAVMIQNKTETTNDSPINTLPIWLKKMYNRNTTYTLRDGHVYDEIHETIERFTVINDSVNYCIVEVGSYTCAKKFIATQLNKKEIQRMEINQECDAELGYGRYDTKTFMFVSSGRFIVTDYRSYLPDSLLDQDGWIKDGIDKDFDDLNPKTDSTKQKFRIDESG